jgi:hypothetical protein
MYSQAKDQQRRQPRIETPKHFACGRSTGRVFKAWSGRALALSSGLQMDWQSIASVATLNHD